MERIRKGDLVQVITGADRGKQGKVLAVEALTGRVRVEKVRIQKRHLRPGAKGARQGGIVEQEGFIHASNVALVGETGAPAGVASFRQIAEFVEASFEAAQAANA